MDHPDLVEIKSAREAAQGCIFRGTGETPQRSQIGGMWFSEKSPALHETCRAILEEGKEPQRVGEILDLLMDLMPIGTDASVSSSHSFAQQAFIPYDLDGLVHLMRLLIHGHARIQHSRLEVTHNDPDVAYNIIDQMGASGLSAAEKDVLYTLKDRRGRVGEPLEVFWQISCLADLAPGAEEQGRNYGGGSIPKLKIDSHLFQIERLPLVDQIKHILDANCIGLVWVSDHYIGGNTLVIELEAITFDTPEVVHGLLRDAEVEMNRKIHEILQSRFTSS